MIIKGQACYFLESNIDTDVIMPAKFLKRIQIDGFQPFAFYEKRYLPETICEVSVAQKDYVFSNKVENPEFPPNHVHAKNASFLVTWENFGCGSSREHAVYGLKNYKVIIGSAPKDHNAFADIFRDNCRQNLIWTPVIAPEDHRKLVAFMKGQLEKKPLTLVLNSEAQQIQSPDNPGLALPYTLPASHVNFLLSGLKPLEKARLEIDQAMQAIDDWNAKNSKKILRPSTNTSTQS